jgi:hypothetical protein
MMDIGWWIRWILMLDDGCWITNMNSLLDNLDIDGYWMWVKTCQMPGNIWSLLSNRGIYPTCTPKYLRWNMDCEIFKNMFPTWHGHFCGWTQVFRVLLWNFCYTHRISFIATFAASPCILLTSHPSWCRSWRSNCYRRKTTAMGFPSCYPTDGGSWLTRDF